MLITGTILMSPVGGGSSSVKRIQLKFQREGTI